MKYLYFFIYVWLCKEDIWVLILCKIWLSDWCLRFFCILLWLFSILKFYLIFCYYFHKIINTISCHLNVLKILHWLLSTHSVVELKPIFFFLAFNFCSLKIFTLWFWIVKISFYSLFLLLSFFLIMLNFFSNDTQCFYLFIYLSIRIILWFLFFYLG